MSEHEPSRLEEIPERLERCTDDVDDESGHGIVSGAATRTESVVVRRA